MKKTYPPMLSALAPLYSVSILVVGLFAAPAVKAQTPLYFHQPQLIEGTAGQVGAGYKFTGVIEASNGQPLTDCIVRIESLSQGVEIIAIDQEDSGQAAAFQPVVEHQQTIGAAAVSFSFEFLPHDPSINATGKYIFPALAASLSGLRGLGDAQAFAECAIGKNGTVLLNKGSRNLLVARSGESFRAQYKWGIEEGRTEIGHPVVFANNAVSGFKLKMGVNSKTSPYKGRSVYEIVLTESVPTSTANETVHFASLAESYDAIPTWMDTNPDISDTSKNNTLRNVKLANNLLVFIPDDMVNQKVTIDILNEKGELRRKIIEEKAPAQLLVEIGDLAAGSYKILVQSEHKKFTMVTIRASQL